MYFHLKNNKNLYYNKTRMDITSEMIESLIKIQRQWRETITKNKYNICRKNQFYESKNERYNEISYGQEFLQNEPELWCNHCILGICEYKH